MSDSFRVAVASSFGQKVDLHFGHADRFLVFALSEGGAEFLEVREVAEVGDEVEGVEDLDQVVELVSDCAAVVCSRAGPHARERLSARGIRIVQSRGSVLSALEELRPWSDGADRKSLRAA